MISRSYDSPADAPTIDSIETDVQPQVLVVDDNKEVRDLIVWLLRISGFRAVTAENGLAAQLILVATYPALIITDLEMPLGSGWDLLAFCHHHRPEIPVMILSGGGLGRFPGIEQWAAATLPKPFDSRKFRAEVEQCLSRAAQHRRDLHPERAA